MCSRPLPSVSRSCLRAMYPIPLVSLHLSLFPLSLSPCCDHFPMVALVYNKRGAGGVFGFFPWSGFLFVCLGSFLCLERMCFPISKEEMAMGKIARLFTTTTTTTLFCFLFTISPFLSLADTFCLVGSRVFSLCIVGRLLRRNSMSRLKLTGRMDVCIAISVLFAFVSLSSSMA